MNVYGLLVEDLFYYSADSIYEKEWIKYILNDVSYVFHDMHMFEQDIAVHASIRDFARFSKEKKEKLYAMHYDDSHMNVKEKLGIQLVQPYQTIKMKK